MFHRKAFDPWRRKIAHLLSASVFAFLVLIPDDSSADIRVNRGSRVIILSGYSSDLGKRDLPVINDRIELFLHDLRPGLAELFDAKVERISEKELNDRLKMRGLAPGSKAAVKEFLQIAKYTHVIFADVQMGDEKYGDVSLQIFTVAPDGALAELGKTREIELSVSESDGRLSNFRQQIFRDFANFRHPDAPRRVTVNCIKARGQTELAKALKLEQMLIEPVTLQIISIHQSQKMKSMGYVPMVHRWSWKFPRDEKGNMTECKPGDSPVDSVISVLNKLPDYIVEGYVGVIEMETGYHKLDLKIQVFRELPTHCETRPIEIDLEFNLSRAEFNLSSDFSRKILAEYEQKWLLTRDACSE